MNPKRRMNLRRSKRPRRRGTSVWVGSGGTPSRVASRRCFSEGFLSVGRREQCPVIGLLWAVNRTRKQRASTMPGTHQKAFSGDHPPTRGTLRTGVATHPPAQSHPGSYLLTGCMVSSVPPFSKGPSGDCHPTLDMAINRGTG